MSALSALAPCALDASHLNAKQRDEALAEAQQALIWCDSAERYSLTDLVAARQARDFDKRAPDRKNANATIALLDSVAPGESEDEAKYVDFSPSCSAAINFLEVAT